METRMESGLSKFLTPGRRPDGAFLAACGSALAGLERGLEALDAAKAGLTTGTYTGSGAETREVRLGFRPRAVFVQNREGNAGISSVYIGGGFALDGFTLYYNTYSAYPALAVVDGGFQVGNADWAKCYTNMSGKLYYYLALR